MAANQKTRRPTGRGFNEHVPELRSRAITVGRDVAELASTAGDVARQQLDPLEDFIRNQPVKSLLIAAGIGAALGLLFGRR